MRGAIPPFPLQASMAWCLVKVVIIGNSLLLEYRFDYIKFAKYDFSDTQLCHIFSR